MNEELQAAIRHFKPCCFYFGHTPQGLQFQAIGIRNEPGVIVARVISVECGKERDENGTKTLWEKLPEAEQYEVRFANEPLR